LIRKIALRSQLRASGCSSKWFANILFIVLCIQAFLLPSDFRMEESIESTSHFVISRGKLKTGESVVIHDWRDLRLTQDELVAIRRDVNNNK